MAYIRRQNILRAIKDAEAELRKIEECTALGHMDLGTASGILCSVETTGIQELQPANRARPDLREFQRIPL
jgi:hypothetical protein